jgi:cytoskeletal protein CcmA (bactofilin family)
MMFIEAGMLLEGNLAVSGTMELNGRLVGNLACTRLEIGPDGYVQGDITAEEVVVEGQIVGTVRARLVDVRGTGVVEGDVFHERLAVAGDAVLTGECVRLKDVWSSPKVATLQGRVAREAEVLAQLEATAMHHLVEEAKAEMPAYEVLRARFSRLSGI